MSVGKVLSGTAKVEVNSAYPAAPAVWVEVGGLLFVVHEQDTVREATGGLSDQVSHLTVDRTDHYVATCFRLLDPDTHVQDQGQATLTALSTKLFAASLGQVRLTLAGAAAKTFLCTADVLDPAGEVDGYDTWRVRLHVAGPVT
jgi:hypothetical protein